MTAITVVNKATEQWRASFTSYRSARFIVRSHR